MVIGIWKRDKRLCLPIIAGCLYVGYLFYRDLLSPQSYIYQAFHEPYTQENTVSIYNFFHRIKSNLIQYLTGFQQNTFLKSIMFLLSVLILLGGAKTFKKGKHFLFVYFLFYSLFLLFWPWSGIRFLVPIIPFILYFLWECWSTLAKNKKSLWIFLFLPLFLFSIALDVREFAIAHFHPYPPSWDNYRKLAIWAGEHLPPKSVVLVRKPYLFYVWSGEKLHTMVYPFSEKESVWKKITLNFKPLYIVLHSWDGTTEKYLKPFIQTHSSNLHCVKSFPNPYTALYKWVEKEIGKVRLENW